MIKARTLFSFLIFLFCSYSALSMQKETIAEKIRQCSKLSKNDRLSIMGGFDKLLEEKVEGHLLESDKERLENLINKTKESQDFYSILSVVDFLEHIYKKENTKIESKKDILYALALWANDWREIIISSLSQHLCTEELERQYLDIANNFLACYRNKSWEPEALKKAAKFYFKASKYNLYLMCKNLEKHNK